MSIMRKSIIMTILPIMLCAMVSCDMLVGTCDDAPKSRFAVCDTSAHIDWDDYNSVSVIFDNFNCHPNEIRYDTIKVCGYFVAAHNSYYCYIDKSHYDIPNITWPLLVDEPNSDYYARNGKRVYFLRRCGVNMEYSMAEWVYNTLSPNDKVYITGYIWKEGFSDGRSRYCNEYEPMLKPISIDSIAWGEQK